MSPMSMILFAALAASASAAEVMTRNGEIWLVGDEVGFKHGPEDNGTTVRNLASGAEAEARERREGDACALADRNSIAEAIVRAMDVVQAPAIEMNW